MCFPAIVSVPSVDGLMSVLRTSHNYSQFDPRPYGRGYSITVLRTYYSDDCTRLRKVKVLASWGSLRRAAAIKWRSCGPHHTSGILPGAFARMRAWKVPAALLIRSWFSSAGSQQRDG